VTAGVLGLAVACTWFLLVNVLVSALLAAGIRIWMSTRASLVATPSTGWLLLRILPTLAALLFLAGAVTPAYLYFEPRDAVEPLGAGVVLLGGLAIALVTWTMGRAVRGYVRARDIERAWLREATPLAVGASPIPAWCVDAPTPGVMLVGIWKPRLYVPQSVVEVLTPEELEVVVGHESGHRVRRDNLKRLLLLASPDALGLTSTGRRVASQWACAAETSADCHAVGRDPKRRVALASALVKVARLFPAVPSPPLPVSTLYDGGQISHRVHRLLEPSAVAPQQSVLRRVALVTAILAGLVALALSPSLLRPVHHATEWLVRLAA
jgi:hypothetical protein